MDPISVARYGMMAASQRFEASALRTARAREGFEADHPAEAVEQVAARRQFSAMTGVIEVADEMWDALLSLQADRR